MGACHTGLPNTPISPPTTFLGGFPPGRWPFLKRKIQHQSITHGLRRLTKPVMENFGLFYWLGARAAPFRGLPFLACPCFPLENWFPVCDKPRNRTLV